ncbi:PREDICTED: ovalbumin-related protein Y-like [Sturnus vulgaris]|uniref:ovalbumin-related protein Y-like n=1 Tax=Sturnus vulgaris TaxID=9172 RepID=UPI00071A66B3|nr:PREDICTED: ovalbumin-related protein Y-like [Sturnus vulgaris]
MGSISAANAEFCFDVFKEVKIYRSNDNVLFSSLSMLSTLALVYMGARGKTQSQMGKVLHFDNVTGDGDISDSQCGTAEYIHKSFKDLLSDIRRQNATYSLRIADRLYIEKTYPILEEYIKCVKKFYRAELEEVDFKTAAEEARQLINSWVEKETNGRIQDLLASDSVDLNTALVFVNVIYFKGIWKIAFKEEHTREEPFNVTEANLSGISSAERLRISEAIHEAYMEVTEEGTEAGGSEVVPGDIQHSSEFEEFRADHPFLFLIKHNPSDMILFFGRYCSP